MKITPPFALSTIAQHFGQNASPLYKKNGLLGHPGIDFGVPWGTPIPCVADNSYCYSLLSANNPNLMAYRAVCTIVNEADKSYEIIYGHCSDMTCVVGHMYATHSIVGDIGNTGEVYSGTHEVTEAEKEAGDHSGAHLHLQVRLLKRVRIVDVAPDAHTLNNGSGRYETKEGYCYEIPLWNNGYSGCIDPAQFFEVPDKPPVFTKDLYRGMTDPDVKLLQERLGVMNTGFFGSLTFGAVQAYQRKYGISPTGYCGPLTRNKLNSTI